MLLALVAGACSSTASTVDAADPARSEAAPDGDLDPELSAAMDRIVASVLTGIEVDDLDILAAGADARVGWFLQDLARLLAGSPVEVSIVGAYTELTGRGVDPFTPWPDMANQMISADTPAPPGYLGWKRDLFTLVEPRWEPFFADGSDVDWRHVSWGGVLIDDRPSGATEPCARGCIPSLDDPVVTDADDGDWYADDRIVFGVVIGDEARAYPRHQMEVHEMVNDTVGGRRIGLPYCTLCGSAQAYFLDDLDGFAPTLRTSGLLIRSNKMMFDLETMSLIDTFTGEASTGPLAAAGVNLTPISVVTSTWGDWKQEHPDTTIVAEDGGIGREYSDNPLGARDADGPIFPIGEVDPRLPVSEPVLGFQTDDGGWVAVPVAAGLEALAAGDRIEIADVTVVADAGGLRAQSSSGEVTSHQAFWFAWSQFHPDTLLWPTDSP